MVPRTCAGLDRGEPLVACRHWFQAAAKSGSEEALAAALDPLDPEAWAANLEPHFKAELALDSAATERAAASAAGSSTCGAASAASKASGTALGGAHERPIAVLLSGEVR